MARRGLEAAETGSKTACTLSICHVSVHMCRSHVDIKYLASSSFFIKHAHRKHSECMLQEAYT